MKILGLYNNECALPLFDYLESKGHEVVRVSEKITADYCRANCFDLAVSYTYKYILSAEILDVLNNNAVNLHNSYLPFNRGASPNLWSLADATVRGVTLHYMDADLDKGFIIAQRIVAEGDGETLKSSYDNLDKNAKELFIEAFSYYEFWNDMKKKAIGAGTYHSVSDTKVLTDVIDSYSMTIDDFLKKIKNNRPL
ncbi:MAG: hypothetical protein J5856_01655 [Lachnospiraceae bacterium]|nr:hypothetical protein [Lachnospiraceae bacterium]